MSYILGRRWPRLRSLEESLQTPIYYHFLDNLLVRRHSNIHHYCCVSFSRKFWTNKTVGRNHY